jgi:pimeloyl-ACP methyl ester carboxylesterase
MMRKAWYPATAAIMALAAGAVPASARADAPPPAQTRQVHVDGYRVTVDCMGTGGPAVILFSGFGDPHTIWAHIQRSLAAHHRVCSYDRPGEGTSSKPHGTQTLASSARLLHDVLAKLHLGGPLVLAGHSIGGDIAADYARIYRRQTAGLVLFDATPPGYLPYVLRLIPAGARGLAKALRAEAVSITSGKNRERLKVTGTKWAPPGALGQLPTAVAEHGEDIFAGTGKYDRPLQNHWASGEFSLAGVSRRSQLIIATRSGHYIYINQPRLALDVINAVIAEGR